MVMALVKTAHQGVLCSDLPLQNVNKSHQHFRVTERLIMQFCQHEALTGLPELYTR